jgi:hypothetical protein
VGHVAARDRLNDEGFGADGKIDFPKYREIVLDEGTVEPRITAEILAELRDDDEELVGTLVEEITILSGIIKRSEPEAGEEAGAESDPTPPSGETP